MVFWLLWFVICFIPVSNIIAIANPMAYRFMYLPSVGLSVFVALILVQLQDYLITQGIYTKLFNIISTSIVVICMIATFFLNLNWQNNIMMAIAMTKDYPEYSVGHLHAGMMYFNAGMNEKAKESFHKAQALGLEEF